MDKFYLTLPKKRVAAGALIFNRRRELLILKPHYRDHWLIPGGSVEANESPRAACIREVYEETGIKLKKLRLAGIDYHFTSKEKTEGLIFIFFGGALSDAVVKKIKLGEEEIDKFKFLVPKKALRLLSKGMRRRLAQILKAAQRNAVVYSEGGRPPSN